MTENAIRDFWVKNHHMENIRTGFALCERITCADGFNISVQASSAYYSEPRAYDPKGGYSSWEAGFPTDREDDLLPYAEEPESPTVSIYAYVPTDVINKVIAKHGGVKKALGE